MQASVGKLLINQGILGGFVQSKEFINAAVKFSSLLGTKNNTHVLCKTFFAKR